jgi:hypothetical protein
MAILSLGLGIGANTSLFTLWSMAYCCVLQRAFATERLLGVGSRRIDMPATFGNISYPDYLDLASQMGDVFEGLACSSFAPLDTRIADKPERLGGMTVSANYIYVLRAPLMLGREFDVKEDRPGAA